jgi:hypothetical protein
MTDVFKGLGLYNNDTSSLQASNNANATGTGDGAGAQVVAQREVPHRLMSIAEALERAKRNY